MSIRFWIISENQRWNEIYLQRNNSIIIDTFSGLLTSTVQCSKCNESTTVTFDPFMVLKDLIIEEEINMIIS